MAAFLQAAISTSEWPVVSPFKGAQSRNDRLAGRYPRCAQASAWIARLRGIDASCSALPCRSHEILLVHYRFEPFDVFAIQCF